MTDDVTPAPARELTPEQSEALERMWNDFAQNMAALTRAVNEFAFRMGESIGTMYATIQEFHQKHPELFVTVDGVPDGQDSPPDPS